MNGLIKCFPKLSLRDGVLRTANPKCGWKPNYFCYSLPKHVSPLRCFSQLRNTFLKSNRGSVNFYSTHPSKLSFANLSIWIFWSYNFYWAIFYVTAETEISLAKFLEKEIIAEQDLQKTKTIPSKINDFEVALNGSEVTFTKQLPNET